MMQPENFVSGDLKNMVCKLTKSIYGLKQASRQWYHKFHQVILSFGFEMNLVDDCVYHKFKGSKFIFLILYVDDILLATNDIGILHETKKFLSKNFEMKDLGDASFVLGIQIHRDRSQDYHKGAISIKFLRGLACMNVNLGILQLLRETSSVSISAQREIWKLRKCRRFLMRQLWGV